MRQWFKNIFDAVVTVADALRASVWTWIRTYDPKRRTFTEHYEYPELPLKVADRFRGFHRYALGTCTGCTLCAAACPVDCIYITREKVPGRKGFLTTSFVIDYSKCLFCALCTEACPQESFAMGSNHDLSCYSRDGCIVDFVRLPPEVAAGRATLNPTVVAQSKVITKPVQQAEQPVS